MERFLASIERSIATENWYAAISLALTLPDICGWLEDPSKGSKQRYTEWFDKYLLQKYKGNFFGPDFAFLTSGDCYAIRCSFLHEGADDISRQRAREVLNQITFSTTGSYLIRINNVLLLNVSAFCSEVSEAVRAWLSCEGARPEIQDRLKELIIITNMGWICGYQKALSNIFRDIRPHGLALHFRRLPNCPLTISMSYTIKKPYWGLTTVENEYDPLPSEGKGEKRRELLRIAVV